MQQEKPAPELDRFEERELCVHVNLMGPTREKVSTSNTAPLKEPGVPVYLH